ncbi:unnamed protein product [Lactuca virosa]|uniref:Uncharacterized protein n=1 Tax=Lactuca virosa TaxID=75947 RepID=A0AAU9LH26_9ASTR|nr:unnamed protein product [Lactuca virosa]
MIMGKNLRLFVLMLLLTLFATDETFMNPTKAVVCVIGIPNLSLTTISNRRQGVNDLTTDLMNPMTQEAPPSSSESIEVDSGGRLLMCV